MKCRKCEYPLWNLREPRCPECGERFDLLSYWFEPGSVVFKCPFCGHPHQGRDARGLPFDAGRCEKCRQLLVVEQMMVEPVGGQFEMDVKSDEDYSLTARKRRTAGQKRAMIAIAIALGVFAAFAFLLFYLRSP